MGRGLDQLDQHAAGVLGVDEVHPRPRRTPPGRVVQEPDAPVAQVLQAEGCAVVCCKNGREALERLAREKFDLVVSDVVMPELDGYQLLLAAPWGPHP